MKKIARTALIEFELGVMDFAEAHEVKTKEELEWLSAELHGHLEMAMEDYAMDEDIEDYDPQY